MKIYKYYEADMGLISPGAQNRSVPIKPHRILGGRGVGKGARAANPWKFTPISGADAVSAAPYTHLTLPTGRMLGIYEGAGPPK